ncbi:MAG TPA: lysophospholipid acyltransferase family protein [Acidimicrobiales bacterium]|nr:lysophospholipid acyltransferase family protein [Acidimicrobiales bacterium]
MGYWIIKTVLTPLMRLAFRLQVDGAERIPRRGPVIVAANHISFIDSLFLPLVLKRRVTFLAKAEYFDNPKTAWFFRMAGQIPIKREGGSAADRALASAREVLADGGMLALYPEGTRSPDGRLYKGRTGVARMAIGCDVPVLPVGIIGTADAQPVGALVPRPFKRVTIKIGAPMHWHELAGRADDPQVLRDVTDDVMDAIAALSGQQRVAHYAKKQRVDESAPAGAGVAAGAGVGLTAVPSGDVLAD